MDALVMAATESCHAIQDHVQRAAQSMLMHRDGNVDEETNFRILAEEHYEIKRICQNLMDSAVLRPSTARLYWYQYREKRMEKP